MSTPADSPEGSPLDRSVRALRQMRARLEQMRARLEAIEGERRSPIAIIGMGCRMPGVAEDVCDSDALWRLLAAGHDAVQMPPAHREVPRGSPLRAGWLRSVDQFDARFFGVSPREAVRMDPQQRLFLEVAWEALAHAGVPPSSLAGSGSGVYAGVNSSDYFWLQLASNEAADTYTINGATHSAIPNRLSYQLDLKGPSLAVDSACSSSLVAVHLACQSLRAGESDTALAGAVNLVLSADVTAVHRSGLPLLADGCSRTFDAGANGYARGEGCGVVVLKRLADAQAAGDRIWAVIRGTALNQDGRTHGVSAPNGTAQKALIRCALEDARVSAASIGYIEAHGTGTELGDPIEAEALAEVYSEGRAAGQLALLGAIKTNIGHLEAAAGVAGLIKAVLALHHELVPQSLHFTRLNPHIELDESRFRVAHRPHPWPRVPGSPRYAAVSSFGAGGTNAHLILEEAPAWVAPRAEASEVTTSERGAPAGSAAERPFVLPLSADREAALCAVAARWSAFLADASDQRLRDACFTAAVRQEHLEHRATLVADSRRSLLQRLDALARDVPDVGVARGRVGWCGGSTRGLVFAFAGMGAHGVDQGRALLADEPAFRRAVEEVDSEVQEQAGWSVIDQLAGAATGRAPGVTAGVTTGNTTGDTIGAGVAITQPTLFALQIGLAALWQSWGVAPDAVVGHSLGEVAAARVAGALSLADAVRVVLARGHLLSTIAGDGAMALVGLAEADAEALIAETRVAETRAAGTRATGTQPAGLEVAAGNGLAVAVVMGHQASVLSGARAEVERAVAALRPRNVFCHMLDVDIAFHSPRVAPLAPALRTQLASLAPRAAAVPFCSTVTGDFVDGTKLDADYWARNLRQPVRFWSAVSELAATRHGFFLELGGHAVLSPAIRQDFEHLGEPVIALPSLRRDEDGRVSLLRALGGLHCAGLRAGLGTGLRAGLRGVGVHRAGGAIDWRAVVGERRVITVPGYPWQRQRFWFDGETRSARSAALEEPASIAAADTEGTGALDRTAGDSSVGDNGNGDGSNGGAPGLLARQLAATSVNRRRELLLGHVLDEAASVLGLAGDEADLEPVQGFFQLGMDSRMAVELTDRLARALDRPLPSTVTFEHPSSDALCDFLVRALDADHDPDAGISAPVALQTGSDPSSLGAKPTADAPQGAEDTPEIDVLREDQQNGDRANDDRANDDVVALLRDHIDAIESGKVL